MSGDLQDLYFHKNFMANSSHILEYPSPNYMSSITSETHFTTKSSMEVVGNEDSNIKEDKQVKEIQEKEESPTKENKATKKGEKKERQSRFAFMTKSKVDHLEDGYRWRKYGQKAVKNSPYPRSYYRCTYQKCLVKKRVERSLQDPSVVITTYEGTHNHYLPSNQRSGGGGILFHPAAAAAAAASMYASQPPCSLPLDAAASSFYPELIYDHQTLTPFQQMMQFPYYQDYGLLQDILPNSMCMAYNNSHSKIM